MSTRRERPAAPIVTKSMRPPHWTNIEMVSTSQVTRETSEPRRSVFWVSTDRSCTCRNALVRSVDSPVSDAGTAGRSTKYEHSAVTATADHGEAARSAARSRRRDPPRRGCPRRWCCWTANGTSSCPPSTSDRQRDGDPDAAAELRRQLDAAPQGLPGGAALARLDAGVVDRRVGTRTHRSAPTSPLRPVRRGLGGSLPSAATAASAASRAYAVTRRGTRRSGRAARRGVPRSTTRPCST